jgi:hypothetical protein
MPYGICSDCGGKMVAGICNAECPACSGPIVDTDKVVAQLLKIKHPELKTTPVLLHESCFQKKLIEGRFHPNLAGLVSVDPEDEEFLFLTVAWLMVNAREMLMRHFAHTDCENDGYPVDLLDILASPMNDLSHAFTMLTELAGS